MQVMLTELRGRFARENAAAVRAEAEQDVSSAQLAALKKAVEEQEQSGWRVRSRLDQAHLLTAQNLSQTVGDFETLLRSELQLSEGTRNRLVSALKGEASRWLSEANGMSDHFQLSSGSSETGELLQQAARKKGTLQ